MSEPWDMEKNGVDSAGELFKDPSRVDSCLFSSTTDSPDAVPGDKAFMVQKCKWQSRLAMRIL